MVMMAAAVDVLFIILVVCGITVSYKIGDMGVVHPGNPYAYIGDTLTITCNLTLPDLDFDSRDLYFTRHNDSHIPEKYVNVTTTQIITLRLPITSPADGGMYICNRRDPTGNHAQIIANQKVKVDYRPKPVREVACRVYNWESMTCTWNLGVEYVHLDDQLINLVYMVGRDPLQNQCKHMNAAGTSCTWKKGDKLDPFIKDMQYQMGVYVTNNKTKETTQATANMVNTSEIVEPAPVGNLTAVSKTTCISVWWTHEKRRRDKVYKVMIASRQTGQWQGTDVDHGETWTVCGLLPYHQYDVSVKCMPRLLNGKKRGFWSRETVISLWTKEGVPVKAPQIKAGSYVETPCAMMYCKKVKLYWKPLSIADANGRVQLYHVDYRHVRDGSPWYNMSVNGTESQLVLDESKGYVVQIRAATRSGVAYHVFSQLLIPSASQKPAVPQFRVETDKTDQETMVTLTWEAATTPSTSRWKKITSYTVFWCKGYHVTGSCQETIQSVDVSPSETQFSRPFSQYETYMFGVAVNVDTDQGETSSSGFKWNKCTYEQRKVPLVSPDDVRLSIYQPDDSISVEWTSLTCPTSRAFIQNYIISICPSVQGDNCTGDIRTILVENTATAYTIENLRKDHRYKVWLSAASTGGVGPDSDALYSIVINRELTAGVIGGIIVAAVLVLLLLLCCTIFCSRRVYITVKQKYFVPIPIEIPHTLPPLPPIPMPPRQRSPDSDSSDGIYEKIDGPPSPCSSTESTTGVEAPLIHSKWKLANLKNTIYGKKKEQRNSYDSGRGSLSHSADTLLMRLHPSHLRKQKKAKQKPRQSESDSGVIMDGRGHVNEDMSEDRSRSDTSEQTQMSSVEVDTKSMDMFEVEVSEDKTVESDCLEVSPYSCVDIVQKMNSTSEQLKRKAAAAGMLQTETCCVNNSGSTLSLPPTSCQLSLLLSSPLDFRTKSAGNELDLENGRLSSMVEGKEYTSSEGYSEESVLDSVDYTDNEVCGSGGTGTDHSLAYHDSSSIGKPPNMTSYIRFVDGEILMPNVASSEKDSGMVSMDCDCVCHRNKLVGPSDGYVTQDAMVNHSEEMCGCDKPSIQSDKLVDERLLKQQLLCQQNGLRPASQVLGLPPHYFSSLSKVDVANTTEL